MDLVELDRRLVKVARKVRVLGTLSWPAEVEQAFFAAGRTALPEPPPVHADLDDIDTALAQIGAAADRGHPAGRFLAETADSYRRAVALLASAGTPAFTATSIALYGQPSDALAPGAPTHLQEAEHLLDGAALAVDPPEKTLSAEEAADALRQQIAPHFPEPLPVELDPHLASLAAAGSRRVRIRGGVRYAPVQVAQLAHHEALVHSATKRNGKAQPVLSSLGLSSPRTTCTQEGLATLAELVTDTLDLVRLRRIALRVRALQAGLDGADFLQVLAIFEEAGQPEAEAFRSTMRLFRGGDVRGTGVVFTKDVVYLRGLTTVHTFLLAALRDRRPELAQLLFVGRLTLGDALALAPLLADGTLAAPGILPEWVANTHCLAAYLAWASFRHRIPLSEIQLHDFA
jgi:uncharacterized protein (TIGR02421 family)